RDGARSDPARARGDRSGQAQGGAAARHQPQDALQQAGEIRHPGGEIGAPDLMTGAPGGSPDRPLPAELARLLHDLRGPLNSAVMHLEVLKRTVAGDATADESLRTVLQQLARLSDMLPAAFAIAALEPEAPRVHDLRRLAERARDARGLPNITLAPGASVRVAGDDTLLV